MSKKANYIRKELEKLGFSPETITYKKPKYIPENFSDGHEGGWMFKFKNREAAESVIFKGSEPLKCEWSISDKDPAVIELYDYKAVLGFMEALKSRNKSEL